MDLYIPSEKNFSTILYVHEGSLLSVDKDDLPYAAIAKKFQQYGIGFANMNYRLDPENKWPAQPDDVVSAFRWLKDFIGDYGGDIKKYLSWAIVRVPYLLHLSEQMKPI